MKIMLLNKEDHVYSSNAYLALGSWNRLEDVNTLIDAGSDESILKEIEEVHTGVGKKRVEQVILTHNHFDHTGNLRIIKERYQPKVYAFNDGDCVDEVLRNRQTMRIGDRNFEVIHTPIHSSDSICLYCEKEGVLFSGDTPLRIINNGGAYPKAVVTILESLKKLDIRTVYSGHDKPSGKGIREMLETTLGNVRTSRLLIL
jgi:glyoxylase-like metal-dependent hydrolase (beta-lactamase superfamily II)